MVKSARKKRKERRLRERARTRGRRRGVGTTARRDATRVQSNLTMAAAGYELRGIYGTEPYWPEKKLKICVTGAGGFIGSHLAKRLKEEGHHVVACDWKRNEHMEVRLDAVRDANVGGDDDDDAWVSLRELFRTGLSRQNAPVDVASGVNGDVFIPFSG